jgi:diguanylate cyclase (GGDEF)-like protein
VWFVLFTGLGVHVVHSTTGAFGAHRLIDDFLYNGLLSAAAALCLLRAASTPADRAAWFLVGGGLAAWSAADLYWTFALADLATPPYPSPSDAGWLVFYPALYAAVILLVRRRHLDLGPSQWLDGLIGALAAAAFVAAVVLPPILAMSLDGTGVAVAVNLAYPVGDVLLLSLLVGTLGVLGWRPDRTFLLLGAGLILSAVADIAYLFDVASGAYDDHSIVSSLWPAAALLTALAAWQPVSTAAPRRAGLRMLFVPAFFTLVAFAVLVWDHVDRVSHLSVALAAVTLLVVFLRMGLTMRENVVLLGVSRHEAKTDALTGLGNRRRLLIDLERALQESSPERPHSLLLFDLNGFKTYNDLFGHPAGDALLSRLGHALVHAAAPSATAYRMGGDEFCVLAGPDRDDDTFLSGCLDALSEHGEGFDITAAFGRCDFTDEALDPSQALRRADRAMYAQKDSTRASAGGQSMEVLVRILAERDGELATHLDDVAGLSERVAHALGLSDADRTSVLRAGVLHDVGKAAIPDAILDKPGPLDEEEWAFMRRHTIIGERILLGAPALAQVAALVRSSHERWDGSGYPDGLAGTDIPLGARIIAVCDAFDAMVTDRPYRSAMPDEEAVEELRDCAGTQFDPEVVEAFATVVAPRPVVCA